MSISCKPTVTFTIVESPYAPFSKNDPERAAVELARNVAYVNACLADSFAKGETPFASHAIYTLPGVLNDKVPTERKKGMQAGFDIATALSIIAWGSDTCNPLLTEKLPFEACFIRAFYVDRGWTSGMADGMLEAGMAGQAVVKRELNKTGPVGYWLREHDADWALDSNGHLYMWRKATEVAIEDTKKSVFVSSGVTHIEVPPLSIKTSFVAYYCVRCGAECLMPETTPNREVRCNLQLTTGICGGDIVKS